MVVDKISSTGAQHWMIRVEFSSLDLHQGCISTVLEKVTSIWIHIDLI